MQLMFTVRKSQEVGYALLRVAVSIRRQDLRSKIERWAMELLESAALNDFEKSLKAINVLDIFVKFAKQLYEIEPINAEILIKELSTLNSAMRQFAGLNDLPSLRDIFSNKKQNNFDNVENTNKNNDSDQIGNAANSIIRQSAILQKMRQSGDGGYQLKDLLSEFPDFSERTLRYDLQKLLSHGLIDRIGSGGPGTSYVMKNNSNDLASFSL